MFTLILIFEGIYGKIEKRSEQISKKFFKINLKFVVNFFQNTIDKEVNIL